MPTPAELKTEIQSGPHVSALAPFVAAGNDIAVADFLNSKTGAGSGLITLSAIPQQALLRAFAPATLIIAGKTAAIKDKWDRALNLIKYMAEAPLTDIDALLSLAVTDGLLTQATVNSLRTRNGSRAEVLWGAGVVVTPTDVSEARRA